ncbi:MAG: tetratricopeptide repeat protein [Dysgonamonadaceae bacterium]|jgi:hypothetical protein|nr:tetratricopeptide repeat protein [Dysgonamonadaceae bacterium]
MKIRYLILAALLLLLASCTSIKNTAGTRWYHAFNTRYNVYFNGNEAFKEAYQAQLKNYSENYSDMILMYPVSALPKEKAKSGGPFNKAVEKAVKAIKMHSIQTKPAKNPGKQNDPKYREFMSRTEYNPFLHNAWMLMAKSQFHNGDFTEAASAFSYIARLYETQPEIAVPAKIWKARCYSELGWYYEAEDILTKLNNEQLPKKQINWFSTVYADYLIKQKQYAEAISYMKIAVKAEKNKYQRTREKYLLGQMYAATGQKDLAYEMFGSVAGSTAPYILQLSAEIRRTEVYPGGNSKKMTRKLEKMTRSDKNKDYLDQIYYALGNLYLSASDTAKATESYEAGVEKSMQNGIAKAMNQIRLGDIYFDLRQYVKAQPNYSEALSQLKKGDEAFPRVSRRSEVLDALVVHVESVELQDSLLRLSRMTEDERLVVVKKIIDDLIKKEEEEKKKAEMDEYLAQQESRQAERQSAKKQPAPPVIPGVAGQNELFYFYNQQAVALGKNTFRQKWGRRKLEDDWRRKNKMNPLSDMTENNDLAAVTDSTDLSANLPAGETVAETGEKSSLSEDPKDPQYYLQQIPATEEDIAAANLIIADGLFNMGVIYKDMLEDSGLAMETFAALNTRYPDNENKLASYHHIYLMHWKQDDMATANLYKVKIRDEFPESDLALAMADPDYEYHQKMLNTIQDSLYQRIYNEYLNGNPAAVREIYGEVADKYNQSQLMPKFMFINALSFVQTQESDMFKVLLKQLVEKYPNEDVSVLAGEIMKGFQRGLLLGSGDNSLAKSGLFNVRLGTVGDAPTDSVPDFTDNANTPHKLLFIFPKGSLDENLLLFTVASFNFGNFMVNDFGLQKAAINDEIGSLEITGFNNLSEVMQYYKMIGQPSGYADDLPPSAVIVPISQDNYTTLMKGKSLNDYMLFFDEHFREGNENLILRWHLKKEAEETKIEEQEEETKTEDIKIEEQEEKEAEEEPQKAEEKPTEPEIPAEPVAVNPPDSIPVAEDEYAEQQEKEQKKSAKQLEKERKEQLKKQRAEDAALLKAQKQREKDLAKLKEKEKKQQEADKKRIAKEKEDARKAKEKEKKEQQKIKQQERKEKERLRKEAQKAREKAREAERKEKRRAS